MVRGRPLRDAGDPPHAGRDGKAADVKARIEVQQGVVADLGSVRYLATLLGSADEATMRWFVLAVALLLDPAAVLLLLAATRPSVMGAMSAPAR